MDRRTGTTTTDPRPPDARPAAEETHDVDDWLTVISWGRRAGVTAEATGHQYQLRRAGRALSTSRGS
ncbi:hypothetical protein ABIE67_000971 [Streptomyces sp. V4I8]